MTNTKKEFSLLFILLVSIFSFLWHYQNLQLPISDSVEYLDAAYTIYMFFDNGEYFNFLISIFNERGWRPIIFQIFIVPFLMISSGNILFSVIMTHFVFSTISAFFIFKILNLFIDNKYSVVISTLILSLSFNILFGGQPLPLFAEISFIAFLLGTIYFLIKSDLFKNKRDSRLFTLFFTLTLLTRPIEGIVFLVPALAVLIWKRYSQYVTLREIISGILYPVFFIWILFISRIFPEVSSSVIKIDPPTSLRIFTFLTIFFSLLLVSLFAFSKYLKHKKKIFFKEPQVNFFKKSLFISSLFLWVWYTPRFGSLYGWVYDTSIGDTFAYLKQDVPPFNNLIISAIQNNGLIISCIIVGLLIVSFSMKILFKNKIINKFDNISMKFNNISLIVCTAIPIPIILYFTTHQITYRKISPVIVILSIYALIVIYQNKNIFRLSNTLLTIFLISQIFFLTRYIYNEEKNLSWNHQTDNQFGEMILGSQFPYPVKSGHNRYDKLISFLQEERNKGVFKKLTLVLKDDEFPIERYLFKFLCKKNNVDNKFFYPKNFDNDNYSYLEDEEAFLLILSKKFRPLISKDVKNIVKNIMEEKKNKMSISDFNTYNFILLFSSGALAKYKFEIHKCYNFFNEYEACLITKDESN